MLDERAGSRLGRLVAQRGEIQFGALTPGMPAEKAGLQKGDLLLTVNGQPIHLRVKFQELIAVERRQARRHRDQAQRHEDDLHVSAGVAKPGRSGALGDRRLSPNRSCTMITTQLSLPAALQ